MTLDKHYNEDDLLPLSGIQHFAFCERQWGLIHVENQWVDNVRTVEGKILHQRADDPYFTETRGDVKIVRSVPLMSKTLGLYGVADVIELQKLPESNPGARYTAIKPVTGTGFRLPSARGMWIETGVRYSIVEYKRGRPKPDDRDEVQLCAQAICLEEMLSICLDYGYLYYGETKHRYRVEFDEALRTRVRELAEKMHKLFKKGITPPPVKDKRCKNCSMVDICVPELARGNRKMEAYFNRLFDDMKNE